MRKCALVILLAVFVITAGCSKKSTKTEEQPTDDYILQTSQTIGAEGGTLSVDDFSLTVPAGAFSTDAELRLYASSEDRPFGDNCATRAFRLEGLPAEYSQPLRIHIKYQDTLSHESFIAVGEEASILGSEELQTVYELFETTDSSGYLVINQPARESPTLFHQDNLYASPAKANQVVELALYYLGITAYHTRESAHFTMKCPYSLYNLEDPLITYFESAYDTLAKMKFDYELDGKSIEGGKMEITVNKFYTVRPGYAGVKEYKSTRYIGLFFDAGYLDLNDFEEMKRKVMCVFFEVIPLLYDEDCYKNEHLWLHVAVQTWSEELLLTTPKYIPHSFVNVEMEPFEGMAMNTSNFGAALFHGYGMSPLIKYLVSIYDKIGHKSILVDMYEDLHNDISPSSAVIYAVNDPPYQWLPDFFKQYVDGNIYGVGSDVLLKADNLSGVFNTKSDSLKTFNDEYPDLSARLYSIDLDPASIDDISKIELSVSSTDVNQNQLSLVVFVLEYGDLIYHSQDNQKVTISGLSDLVDAGCSKLLAVVVNSACLGENCNATSDIELKVKRSGGEYKLKCYFAFFDQVRKTYPEDPDEISDRWLSAGVSPSQEQGLEDSTYELTWANEQKLHYLSSGTASITLSEDYSVLRKLDLSYTEDWDDDAAREVIISVTELQRVYQPSEPAWLYYELTGLEVCQHLDITKHIYVLPYNTGVVWEHIDGSCDCSPNPSWCELKVWLYTGEEPW